MPVRNLIQVVGGGGGGSDSELLTKWKLGRFYRTAPGHTAVLSSQTHGPGTQVYSPIYIPHACTIKELAINLITPHATSADQKLRLVIFDDRGDFYPFNALGHTPLIDVGTTAEAGVKFISVNIPIPKPGWYWVGFNVGGSTGNVTLSSVQNASTRVFATSGSTATTSTIFTSTPVEEVGYRKTSTGSSGWSTVPTQAPEDLNSPNSFGIWVAAIRVENIS